MKRIIVVAIFFLMSINLTNADASALAQTSATPEALVRQFYE
jgi:hypothetical protein